MGGANLKNSNFSFTSESVTEGHPDKLADQISDAVLDALLEQDPMSRVACESLLTTGMVMVAGEISTSAYVEIPEIVRRTLEQVGYTRAKFGFDYQTCGVMTAIQSQSPDIAMGVDVGGAGDQGMMFGYACNDTPELMPVPIMLAHKLARQLASVRKNGDLRYLRPDGKSQVTVRYENGKPVRVEKVVVSAQHQPNVPQSTIREDIIERVIRPVFLAECFEGNSCDIYVNPTGNFAVGGPQGDTGLTGRKIIVDTYGGMARHGGGCFSGKDPTKVDRSAAYMMRYVAKNIVAAELADKCEIQVAYAIGQREPMNISVDTFGTGRVPDERIVELIRRYFDLTPAGIMKKLDLRRPIYKQTAAYGHFGRTDLDVAWEDVDMAETLQKESGM
ncbi:MAG: methionine adenosyltransferase [Armatimonadetes bacterium]|nr:methionine adenosyltransferase [Armatimonadota bacterium]